MSASRDPGAAKRVAVYLAAFAMLALYVYKVAAFFGVTPGHDFPGDLRYAEMLAESLRQGTIFPDWIADEALGRPSTVQRSSTLLFMPVALLHLLGVGVVPAAKIWLALLHTASMGAFYFCGRLHRLTRATAVLGALAYGVSRLHLQSFVSAGHWQLGVAFFLAPLLVAVTVLLVRSPTERRVAILALLLAWGIASDNTRTLTTLPLVLAFAVKECLGPRVRPRWRRSAAALGGAMILGALVSAAATLPLLLERDFLAMARDPWLFAQHKAVTFSHPLYVLDGGAFLYPYGEPRPAGAGGVRASVMLVVVASAAAIASVVTRRSRKVVSKALLRHGPALGAILVFVLWLGTSTPSWAVSTFRLYPARSASSFALGVAITLALCAVASLAMARLDGRRRVVLFVAAVFFFCVPAGPILAWIPGLSFVANSRWFLQVNLGLVTSLLFAMAVGSLLSRKFGSPLVRGALAFAMVGLFLFDVLTNERPQSVLDPRVETAARATNAALASDPVAGRYLPYPYVEADATESFEARFIARPSASAWLLWSGSRLGVERIGDLYRRLAALETDPALLPSPLYLQRAEEVLRHAAAANVRFLVEPASFHGHDALVRAGLLVQVPSLGDRVLRNALHDRDMMVTAQGRPLPYRRASPEVFSIDELPPGIVEVAESYYPYWSATVDGDPKPLRAQGGFLSVDTGSGGKNLELRYARPPTDRTFAVASVLGLVAALGLLTRRRSAAGPRRA